MHSLLINREGWARKLWIGEGANRDGDCAIETFARVVDRCPTFRTEPERDLGPLISDADKLLACPRDRNGARREPSLCAKDTTGSSLAGKAVTYRDTNWLASDMGLKLATAA